MMGCVISPLLFIMCMEMLLRGAKDATEGEIVDGGIVLPPMKAFTDDVTTLTESRTGTELLLQRLNGFFEWCRMKAKPKKCRSLSIVHGQVKEIYFSIGGDQIPTVKEQRVKSLGRWYSIPLTDRHRGTEIEKTAKEGLIAINETDLPGKLKALIFQHGLLPLLLWPLQIYEVTLTRVEAIQRHVNKCLRKWLGVPLSFTTVGLYSRSAKVQLPLSSVVDEFKAGKVRLHMMLRDSPDQVIREVQPVVKSGRKWTAVQAVTEAEASLRTKDIVGAVQDSRAGLGNNVHRWFSTQGPKGRARNCDRYGRQCD